MKPTVALSLLLACGGNVDQTVIDAAVGGSDKESGASTDGLVSNDTGTFDSGAAEASTVESGAADDGPICPSGETACPNPEQVAEGAVLGTVGIVCVDLQ